MAREVDSQLKGSGFEALPEDVVRSHSDGDDVGSHSEDASSHSDDVGSHSDDVGSHRDGDDVGSHRDGDEVSSHSDGDDVSSHSDGADVGSHSDGDVKVSCLPSLPVPQCWLRSMVMDKLRFSERKARYES